MKRRTFLQGVTGAASETWNDTVAVERILLRSTARKAAGSISVPACNAAERQGDGVRISLKA